MGNFPPVYKAGAIERYATGAVEEATGLEPAKPVKVSAVFESAALPNYATLPNFFIINRRYVTSDVKEAEKLEEKTQEKPAIGALDRTRTCNILLTKQLLYRLSYGSIYS